MKKISNIVLLSALAFLFLGCPTPNGAEEPVNYTVSFSTKHGTTPKAITVEENTVLEANQLPELTEDGYVFKGWFDGETQAVAGEYTVTKDVTLTAKWDLPKFNNTEPFPFEYGKTYNGTDDCSFIFNSDGTAKFEEKTSKGTISQGYEYKYTADTKNQVIYCYVEKVCVKDESKTLDEVNEMLSVYSSEDKFREQFLLDKKNRDSVVAKLVDAYTKNGSHTEEEIEAYEASITDDNIWDFYLQFLTAQTGQTFSNYLESMINQYKITFFNCFSIIQKFKYEKDETTKQPISIYRVVYENAKLKDFITRTCTGELSYSDETGNISIIDIRTGNFIYKIKDRNASASYTIKEIKNGKIYINNSIGISQNAIDAGYPVNLEPIPYTETGKGENLVVTITFEGRNYTLKFKENKDKILFQ